MAMSKEQWLEFWKTERNKAKYVIEKINRKDWKILPPEYEQEPDKAVKHFLGEIKFFDEKIKNFVI